MCNPFTDEKGIEKPWSCSESRPVPRHSVGLMQDNLGSCNEFMDHTGTNNVFIKLGYTIHALINFTITLRAYYKLLQKLL